MKKGMSKGLRMGLLVVGVLVAVVIIVSVKSAMDLRREYNLTDSYLYPKEDESKDWAMPEEQDNGKTEDKKCYQNVKYNVTLNRTIEKEITNISCRPEDYAISLNTVSREWKKEIFNGSVKNLYYIKNVEIRNNENVSLCAEIRLDFVRKNLLGNLEPVKEDSVTLVKPLIKQSVTPLRYKWYTEKDMKKDYVVNLVRILPKEECDKVFIEEFIASRIVGDDVVMDNEAFLERKRVEGCYKNITRTIEEIEYYNETRVRTEEVKC